MGGRVDPVGNAIGKVMGDTLETVNRGIDNVVVGILGNEIGGGIVNIRRGLTETAYHLTHGAATGDWNEFSGSLSAGVTSAIAVVAIVVGVIGLAAGGSGAGLIASGITILDHQYNKGKFLHGIVSAVGRAETAVFGTHYIEEYSAYIEMAIYLIASYVAMDGAFGALQPMLQGTEIASIWTEYSSLINGIGGGYSIYQTYAQIQNIKEYYENLIAQMLEEYARLAQQAGQRVDRWFNLFTDPDMIGRIMAGGDLYNGGAGSQFFSVTDAHEPSYLMLASESKRVDDIDGIYSGLNDSMMAGGRDYMYSLGAGIKYN